MSDVLREDADQYENCGCPPAFGHNHPRLFTPPLRELTPETSDGFACIAFAIALGLRLLPWQKFFLIHALELLPSGAPRFKTIVLLVSRQAGKTTLATLIMLFWSVRKKKKTVVCSAQDMATAQEEIWNTVVQTFRDHPLLAGQMIREPMMAAGKICLYLTENRRVIPKASNAKAGRGLSIDGLFMDELRAQKNFDAWDALTGATIARKWSQVLTASNAGEMDSVVLAFQRDSSLQNIKESVESGTGFFEWSIGDDDDPGDPESWRKSEPGLGYTITIPDLRAKYHSMPPGSFLTEYCTRGVMRLDSPIDIRAWEDMTDSFADLRHVFKRKALHLAVEVSHDAQHVTLMAAGIDRAGESKRVRVGVIKSWAGKGAVTECEKELKDIVDKARPRDLVWFPGGPGGVLKVAVSKIRSTRVVEYRGPTVSAACAAVAEQISARNVINGGEALLTTQILAAKRIAMGDGWRFDVRGVGGHVDALYGLAAVVQQARLVAERGPLELISGDDPEQEGPV